jgi:hypothetical protein
MEFVRKFTDLQALMGMIIGWPVSSFLREKGLPNLLEAYKTHKINIIIRMICSLILSIITLPLTVAFYIIWFIILCLNSFHNFVNKLYYEGKQKYRPFYKMLIGLNLFAYKMTNYKKTVNINEKQVMKEIEKRDIPILPILGIILITIAFVMQLL